MTFATAERTPRTEGKLFARSSDDGRMDGGFRKVTRAHAAGNGRAIGARTVGARAVETGVAVATGIVMRATAATSGTAVLHVRAAVKGDGTAASESIRTMVALMPEGVIFVDGRIFDTDGAVRLRDAFAWLT